MVSLPTLAVLGAIVVTLLTLLLLGIGVMKRMAAGEETRCPEDPSWWDQMADNERGRHRD